ncbi:MAG: hypothetical protein R3246_14540, partial [Acidimicrobiia bacterium]|nr:hypothetical protein [Acidimicrobiia bacterium]
MSQEPSSSSSGSGASSLGDFRSGPGMITLGSLLIIGLYVITGLLADEYWISWIVLVPAITVVALSRFGQQTAEAFAPVPVILKVLGYLIALLALLDLVEDLRFASSALDE